MHLKKLEQLYPNKRAIITGANSGLGLELANTLSQNNWKLGLCDINPLTHETLQHHFFHQFDITNQEKLHQFIFNFCTQHNGTDLVFCNAGVGEGSLFQDYSLENWDYIIDINLKSVITTIHHTLPFLNNQNQPSQIIVMASMAGYLNLPKMSPYNTTKAALISLCETLNYELNKQSIYITCVTPTFFQSNILQFSRGDKNTLNTAQKIVNNAQLTSKDAAEIILKKLHKKPKNITFPFSAKNLYRIKRFFPTLFSYLVQKKLS